jgi:hypothetical protein
MLLAKELTKRLWTILNTVHQGFVSCLFFNAFLLLFNGNIIFYLWLFYLCPLFQEYNYSIKQGLVVF